MTYTYAVKLVALLDVAFIAFLILSGYVGGWMGQIIYALAFIIPLLAGIFCSEEFKRRREEVAGVAEAPDGLLRFTPDIAGKLAPLAAPTVAIVFLTSLLTSLFLSLFGVTSAPVENKGIVTMLIVHALTPAVLEEALFRYLPMKLILPYSKRFCVFYSAFCFAMIHCNFSQMPYAFVAGVIFKRRVLNLSLAASYTLPPVPDSTRSTSWIMSPGIWSCCVKMPPDIRT